MMRKAVTDGTMPAKEASGRRYWMRAASVGAKAAFAEGGGKRAPKTRFLEPYRLSDDRRATLLDGLATAGVGDAESRNLFASAVEYDIANARQAGVEQEARPVGPPQTPAPAPLPEQAALPTPAQDTAGLANLAVAARSLAEHLGGLDDTGRVALGTALRATDPFRRGYDGGYFDALCVELHRIAGAATSLPAAVPVVHQQPAPPPAPPEPPMSAGGRRFLRRVGRVYEEVLESKVGLTPDGPFLIALRLIAEEAGIPLPRDADTLSSILQER